MGAVLAAFLTTDGDDYSHLRLEHGIFYSFLAHNYTATLDFCRGTTVVICCTFLFNASLF